MRVGYGFNRSSADFAHVDVERLHIDTRDTDRGERADLLIAGLRSGDTLVLLAPGDLGRGAELPPLRKLLAERGVTVEVAEPKEPKRPRGRPTGFDPTPEQDRRIKKLWYQIGIYQMKHVLQRAEEIYGSPVSRNQLDRRYGPRNGSQRGGRK